MYDAVEACRAQLGELLAARQTPAAPAGGLFSRTTDDLATPARVTWTFKTTPANRRVLDDLATVHGAASRSELVSVALEAAFPASPRDRLS